MDSGAIFFLIIAVVAVVILVILPSWQEKMFEEAKNPFHNTPEQLECFKWGGTWSGGKNIAGHCENSRSVPPDEDGNCKEGYVGVEINPKYGISKNCFTQEYFDSVKCEKYWKVFWTNSGFGCETMRDDEIAQLKLDEILENQKKILDSLQENQRSP